MEINGRRWRFLGAPNISDEELAEAARAICKFIVCGRPQTPEHSRRVAIRTAMAQYEGSLSGRAKMLADRYGAYLASGWKREHALESLPYPRSTERVCLHRLARINSGKAIGSRRIFDIANCPDI